MARRSRPRGQPVAVVAHVVRGPEPIGSAAEENIDQNYGLRLAGACSGTPRIGMPTYSVGRFSGDCGPIQNFGRGRFAGATTSWKGSLNEGQTPGNPVLSNGANPVLRAMVANQLGTP